MTDSKATTDKAVTEKPAEEKKATTAKEAGQLRTALHQIETKNGSVASGSVFKVLKADLDQLYGVGAIRMPTKQELAVYEQIGGKGDESEADDMVG